jgi:hypothetical protein
VSDERSPFPELVGFADGYSGGLSGFAWRKRVLVAWKRERLSAQNWLTSNG